MKKYNDTEEILVDVISEFLKNDPSIKEARWLWNMNLPFLKMNKQRRKIVVRKLLKQMNLNTNQFNWTMQQDRAKQLLSKWNPILKFT